MSKRETNTAPRVGTWKVFDGFGVFHRGRHDWRVYSGAENALRVGQGTHEGAFTTFRAAVEYVAALRK